MSLGGRPDQIPRRFARVERKHTAAPGSSKADNSTPTEVKTVRKSPRGGGAHGCASRAPRRTMLVLEVVELDDHPSSSRRSST